MKFLYLLAVFWIFGAIIVVALAAVPVSPEIELKAPKNKILRSGVIIEFEHDENGFIIEDTGRQVIKYDYIDNKEALADENELIEKRTNNAKIYKTNKPFEFRAIIYAGESFYKDTNNKWYEVETTTTTIESFNQQTTSLIDKIFYKNSYAQSITASSTAGDGWCEVVYNVNWDVPHDAANCNSGYTTYTATENQAHSLSNTAATGYKMARGLTPFNTSGIPANATIVSSTLKLYVTAKNNDDNDGDDFIVVVGETTQASSASIVSEDYDQVGAINNPSEGSSRVDITSITTAAYNSWIFNATGTAWIKKSGETSNCGTTAGITCIGVREGHDVIDSPIAVGGGLIMSRFKWSSQESATNKPLLDITYTVPPSGAVSCSVDNSSTAFGALATSAVATSSPNVTVSSTCTYSAGCTMTVLDAGSGSNPGLWNSTSSVLIESPNAAYVATTTLAAGTEGYGIRATTTASGSGGTLGIATRYNTGLASGLAGSEQNVGGFSLTAITLASSTTTYTSREIVVTHKAAIAADTPGGTYSDIITYGCTGN